MLSLPTLLTVTLAGVAVGALIFVYQLLVLPVQGLGVFLVVLGLLIALLAKRFGRLLCLQRGAFNLTRSPLVLSCLLVLTGTGILLFGPLALLFMGIAALWRFNGRLNVRRLQELRKQGLRKSLKLSRSYDLKLRR